MNTNIDNTAHVKGRCEGEHLWKDFSPVPGIVSDFAFNVLNPLGLLYRPVVDEDYLTRGGVLTLLCHPNAVANPLWWALYPRTLEHLHRRGAWFRSVREIGEIWKVKER